MLCSNDFAVCVLTYMFCHPCLSVWVLSTAYHASSRMGRLPEQPVPWEEVYLSTLHCWAVTQVASACRSMLRGDKLVSCWMLLFAAYDAVKLVLYGAAKPYLLLHLCR